MDSHLTCAICLEHFKVPVTLSCGHSFCQTCINQTWDSKNECDDYQCPYCSCRFPSRPMLKRNVSLSSVLSEAANRSACRETLPRAGEGARAMQLCQRHKKPLVYYCKQDRTSVCYECGICDCKSHDMVLLETERENQEVRPRADASLQRRVLDAQHLPTLQLLLERKTNEVGKLIKETEEKMTDLAENISQAKVEPPEPVGPHREALVAAASM